MRSFSLRLVALLLAAALPVIVIASALVVHVAREERRAVEAETQARAARLVDLLERKLEAHRRVLEALATSANLDGPDLRAFHAEAARVLASQPDWLTVILLDLQGSQLVSARQPFERAPVKVIEPASYVEVLRSGRPTVGGISEPSPRTGERAVPVRVPVRRGGVLRFVLTAPVRPEGFADLFAAGGLPPDWVGAFLDRDGRVVARSRDAERYVGQPATEPTRAAALSGRAGGLYASRTLDGTEVTAVFATSAATGWSVHLGIPNAVFAEPRRRAVLGASLGGAATLLMALALALLLHRDVAARRRTAEILESIGDAFYALDRDFRFVYANRRALELWGRKAEEVLGRPILEVFPELARSPPYEAQVEAMRHGAPVHLETLSPVLNRWLSVSIYPAPSGLSVYFRDIGERKAAEERQRLLVAELSHRVKNTLAVVQSLAARSLTEERTVAEARAVFTQRLRALAAAHGLLTRSEWRGADLRALAAGELEPYASQATFVGEPVALEPKAALTLALVLHELATNAAKHGALSVPEGQVRLAWQVVDAADGRRLRFSWEESGGPAVAGSPTQRGFGRVLLESAIAHELGGSSRLEFRPGGVAYRLEAPLRQGRPSTVPRPERLATAGVAAG